MKSSGKVCGCGRCDNTIDEMTIVREMEIDSNHPGRTIISNNCPNGVPENSVVDYCGSGYKVYIKRPIYKSIPLLIQLFVFLSIIVMAALIEYIFPLMEK